MPTNGQTDVTTARALGSDDGQRLAFLIFEGGGAKGIAHLGALRAMEDLGYAFAGVAGTSAGAFVAALVAAGYRSAELLDPDVRTKNLLATTGQDPIDLLGAKSWKEFGRVRRSNQRLALGALIMGAPLATFLAPLTAWTLRRLWFERGHFDTAGVREFVNGRIRERLQDLYVTAGRDGDAVPDPVCFGDLNFSEFNQLRPLKIIATDVSGMRPVLFDSGRTPGVAVADAVAASLAIPFVFRPVRVRDRTAADGYYQGRFVDGGLVSNLPFWVFAEEKLSLERSLRHSRSVPVIAFTLTDPPPLAGAAPATPDESILTFLTRTVRTAIFGSQSIAQSLLRDLTVVKLPTRLGVLDFDAPWKDIRADYVTGRQHTTRRVDVALHRRPSIIRGLLRETAEGVQARMEAPQAAGAEGAAVMSPRHLRACLVEPYGTHSLRVSHGFNMDDDADDRLPLDRRAGQGASDAFRTRDIQILRQGASGNPLMTKYERALIRQGLSSALCVPIFDDLGNWSREDLGSRDEPLGVLCVDSDSDLAPEFDKPAIIEFVVDQTALFGPALAME